MYRLLCNLYLWIFDRVIGYGQLYIGNSNTDNMRHSPFFTFQLQLFVSNDLRFLNIIIVGTSTFKLKKIKICLNDYNKNGNYFGDHVLCEENHK